LLVCGCCGGLYALRGQDCYACSNHVMNGSCTNSRTIAREPLEARMLDGLRDRLMAPEIAAEAMRAYAEEPTASIASGAPAATPIAGSWTSSCDP
jgi:site-specific DNA recombinase